MIRSNRLFLLLVFVTIVGAVHDASLALRGSRLADAAAPAIESGASGKQKVIPQTTNALNAATFMQWAVRVRGGHAAADQVASDLLVTNLGQVGPCIASYACACPLCICTDEALRLPNSTLLLLLLLLLICSHSVVALVCDNAKLTMPWWLLLLDCGCRAQVGGLVDHYKFEGDALSSAQRRRWRRADVDADAYADAEGTSTTAQIYAHPAVVWVEQ